MMLHAEQNRGETGVIEFRRNVLRASLSRHPVRRYSALRFIGERIGEMTIRAMIGTCLLAGLIGLPSSASAQKTINQGGVEGELYLPAVTPAPGVFVLHTLAGAGSGDAAMAKALTAAGFVAFVPHYGVRGKVLDSWVQPAIDALKARPEVAGKPLGAVGFSAGGARVFWMAAREPRIKAVVSYYGTYDYEHSPLKQYAKRLEYSPIRMVDRLSAAVLMLNGGADNEVPVEQVERMKQAVARRGLPVEAMVYPGVYHNFDRGRDPGMQSDRTVNGTIVAYDSKAAADAQARTIAWFQRYLK